MKISNVEKLSVLGVLLGLAYVPAFVWMYAIWTARDTYYSHGFLVPFICGFIIWHMRRELSRIPLQPNPLGWTVFGAGLSMLGVATLWNVGFLSGFSLLPVLLGLTLLFGGKEWLKRLSFPILFLAFMIPLPQVAVTNLSFRLKIFAAQLSTHLVNHFGIPALREGSLIKTQHSSLMVEDPCSGIRSLIAMIALGALMAYFCQLSKPKRIIVFLSSVPIAVATNVMRITTLAMIGEIYGRPYATGVVHDTIGILAVVLAIFGLSAVVNLLE
jgi:exosortase